MEITSDLNAPKNLFERPDKNQDVGMDQFAFLDEKLPLSRKEKFHFVFSIIYNDIDVSMHVSNFIVQLLWLIMNACVYSEMRD